MTDTIIDIDSQVLLYINSMRSGFLDYFMWIYTNRFTWIPLYLSIIFVILKCYRWKSAVACIVLTALVILIADQTCSHILRPYFLRMRPSNPDNPLSAFVTLYNGYRSGAYGFPSCHGANSLALATFTSLLFKNRGFTIFIYLWAIINCYSRIYLGVHYPGDILVGATIGVLAALLIFGLMKLLGKRQSFTWINDIVMNQSGNITFTEPHNRIVTFNATLISITVGILTIIIIASCSL